jgi:hypothetical protein
MRQSLHDSEPEPIPESAAEAPQTGRDRRGRFAPGNRVSLKHGAYVAGRRPPQLEAMVGDLDAFRAGLESDQGGQGELTAVRAGYVRRLGEVEALCRLLGADLMARGIFTRKGRTRSTFGAFLQAAGTWDRLAGRLGLDRRQRDVIESPREWLERIDGNQHEHEPEGRADDGS